ERQACGVDRRREHRRSSRLADARSPGRSRTDSRDTLGLGGTRLPRCRSRARRARPIGTRPLRRADRPRSARRVRAAVADRGHHPGARARARHRRASFDRRRWARADGARVSLRPGGQGPRDRDGRGSGQVTVSTAPTGTARIARAFARARGERRLAIVVYLTVGYPDRAATGALLRAALDGGADLLELGVPFSDPLADGATVQRASEVALRHGVSLADCLGEASTIVRERDATVLLMGYANPFLRYRGGLAGFAADAARAGVAGIIVPDLPSEESAEFDAALVPEGLARIDLYAPTTPDDRLARVVPRARGFA